MNTSAVENSTDLADHDMLRGPVFRTYWRYSLPWALGMVATASATVVDGIFVGRFAGPMALASINLVAPAFTLLSGVGYMLVTGGSVRAGKYMGEKNAHGASAMMLKTLVALLGIVGLLCLAVALNMDTLFRLLGVNEELYGFCYDYFSTLLPFIPVVPLCYALSYFIRVDQRPVLASMGLALSAGLNIVLDAITVGWLGMGVRGAALSTGLAFSVPILLFVPHFFSRHSSYVWPKRWGGWKEMMSSAWNGASEFVNEVSAGLIILIFNRILMDRFGANGVAAFTVVNYTTMLGLILFYGLGDSLAPIISVNRGAGEYGRAKAFLKTALGSVLALELALFFTFTFAPDLLTRLFLPGDTDTSPLTLMFIQGWRWAFLFSGLNMVMASCFTGMQWATCSMLVAFSRSLAMPLLMLLILPRVWGDSGIFYATSAAEALTFALAIGLYVLGGRMWDKSRVSNKQDAPGGGTV